MLAGRLLAMRDAATPIVANPVIGPLGTPTRCGRARSPSRSPCLYTPISPDHKFEPGLSRYGLVAEAGDRGSRSSPDWFSSYPRNRPVSLKVAVLLVLSSTSTSRRARYDVLTFFLESRR